MISILQGRLKLDGNFFKQERTCALKSYWQNWRSPDDCEKNAAELYSRTEQWKSLPLRLGCRKVKDSPKQKGKLSSTLLRIIYGVQHPDRVRQGSRNNWVKYCRYSFPLQFSEWLNLDLCFIERYFIFQNQLFWGKLLYVWPQKSIAHIYIMHIKNLTNLWIYKFYIDIALPLDSRENKREIYFKNTDKL